MTVSHRRRFGRCLALSALGVAVLPSSGCTKLLHNDVVAKDVFAYTRSALPPGSLEVPARYVPGQGVPRSEVIRHLGTPVATWTFHPPITARQTQTRGIVVNEVGYNLANVADTARIGRIDEFRVHGLIYDGNKFSWEDDFLKATLGLGDLLLFPFNLWDFLGAQSEITPVRVFFRPDDTVLFETLAPDRTPPRF